MRPAVRQKRERSGRSPGAIIPKPLTLVAKESEESNVCAHVQDVATPLLQGYTCILAHVSITKTVA